MAKRPLKAPTVPPGARRKFFGHLHCLLITHGDPSTPQLGRLIGYSHQAVYKALTGPKVPSWGIVERLVQNLAGAEAVQEAKALWDEAVREERGLTALMEASNSHPRSAPAEAPTLQRQPAPIPAEVDIPAVEAVQTRKPDRPTKLDAIKADQRSSPALPPVPKLPDVSPEIRKYRARTALANEIRRLNDETGAAPGWYRSRETNANLARWAAGEVFPVLQQLLNFAYELQLDEDTHNRLISLHVAAAKELRPTT